MAFGSTEHDPSQSSFVLQGVQGQRIDTPTKSSSVDTIKATPNPQQGLPSIMTPDEQSYTNARASPTLQLARDPTDVTGSLSHDAAQGAQAQHEPYAQTSVSPCAPPPTGKSLPYEGVVNAAATHVVPQNPPPSAEDAPRTAQFKAENPTPGTFSPPTKGPRDSIQQQQEEQRAHEEAQAGREHNLGRDAGQPGKEEDLKHSGAEADVRAGEIRELEEERGMPAEPLLEGETLEQVERGVKTPNAEAGVNTERRRKPRRSMTDSMANLTDEQRDEFQRAFGSTRIGTSALISALSALPMDPESEDDSSDSSESEDEEAPRYGTGSMTQTQVAPKRPQVSRLHSSLHTIRPLHRRAQSTQRGMAFPFGLDNAARKARSPGGDELAYQLAARATDGAFDDEFKQEAEEAKDILYNERENGNGEPREQRQLKELTPAEAEERKAARRERLAERMMEVFGLEEKEEVKEEFACWLLKDVMLKGYMYLTSGHICFFALMPEKEVTVTKTGPLTKKASKTKMNNKYWFVLRNDVLSWFESTTDPYFPRGNVSLQYASSCEPVDETRFKLRTAERSYSFAADTPANRDDWVKAIRKVMFKVQNEGETIKLVLPLETIDDVERRDTVAFAETIELKILDLEDSAINSYFFAYFQDTEAAYSSIHGLLQSRPPSAFPPRRASDTLSNVQQQEDEDASRSALSSSPVKQITQKLGAIFKTSRGSSDAHDAEEASVPGPRRAAVAMHTVDQGQAPIPMINAEPTAGYEAPLSPETSHSYPPSVPEGASTPKSGNGIRDWIRKPTTKIFGSSPNSQPEAPIDDARPQPVRKATETIESVEGVEDSSGDARSSFSREAQLDSTTSSLASQEGLDYSMLEGSETGLHQEVAVERKFRRIFALPYEKLVDHFPGSLVRLLPVAGHYYISENYICFRSTQVMNKTRMVLPIRDIFGLKAQSAFRIGHVGLVVILKGHEELFFEFTSNERRKACVVLLENHMERLHLEAREAGDDSRADETHGSVEQRILEDLDEKIEFDPDNHRLPPVSPSPMFASTASTFLDFKPAPMKVTCLSIGSRGDVQPYIALCKALQAEGHSVRIASHEEYREWVVKHGIEFEPVGGDPAMLMELCTVNGMFTVNFMKEVLSKFGGWLEDLLQSAWKACQGSDLLIESPSSMAGIHVAEGLQIPYFRAFTMPWTRTRAYPHAFGAKDHKSGGGYNYMTYTMFDQVFWRFTSARINRWRKNTIGIPSTTFEKLEQHKVPFLYNFSPSIVPPPLDWPEWIHVTGYWFLDDDNGSANKQWKPPQNVVDFIDKAHNNGKKVVYIGFGSIVVSDPAEMTRQVVDAVKESGVYAILCKGWSDRGAKKDDDKDEDEKDDSEGADGVEYPDEILAIDKIDHAWLFPQIDAACHHGGAGSTGASLRAGIPTIIKPFFGDQYFWAERVETLNVGAAMHTDGVESKALAEALIKATTDEKQITKARVVGEMIRKEHGVRRATEAIYRDLEYAKSLIKRHDGELVEVPSRDEQLPEDSNMATQAKVLNAVKAGLGHGHGTGQEFNDQDNSTSTSEESWSMVSDRDDSPARRSGEGMERIESNDSRASGVKKKKGLGGLVGNLIPKALKPEH